MSQKDLSYIDVAKITTEAIQGITDVAYTPMSMETITVTNNIQASGVKYDQEKPDMSLLSPIAIKKMAEVMTFGKKKYSANNWRGGIVYTRLIAAALRHIFSYLGGETFDPETGKSHLAHAMCCLMMVLEFEETRPDLDDRYKKE